MFEPFFGSGAVLLARPHPPGTETVNDQDGFVCNFYRAVQADPEAVARYTTSPAHECDLHARHAWLKPQRATLTRRLEGDPDYYDPKLAGWWVWGLSLWIGRGWCGAAGDGPWEVVEAEDGTRQLLSLGETGQGVCRQRLHLFRGQGVHRKHLHLEEAGQGVRDLFTALAQRLQRVRIACGDWQRVCSPFVTWQHGLTGILLDPPYSTEEDRDMHLYGVEDGQVAHAVQAWCLAHGAHPLLRIVLCGYGEAHDVLLHHGWQKYHWLPHGGMGNYGQGRGRANKLREQIWASPACLTRTQLTLGW
jgi:DNA adenine methylase